MSKAAGTVASVTFHSITAPRYSLEAYAIMCFYWHMNITPHGQWNNYERRARSEQRMHDWNEAKRGVRLTR